MPGLLDRPEDRESPDEERAVQKLTRKQTKILADLQFRLKQSVKRTTTYLARLDMDNYARERRLQDRMLDELLAEMPTLRFTGDLNA